MPPEIFPQPPASWWRRWRHYVRPTTLRLRLQHRLAIGERIWEKLLRAYGRYQHRLQPARRHVVLTRPANHSTGPAELLVSLDPRDTLTVSAVRRALTAAWPTDLATVVVLIRYRHPPLIAGRMDAPVHSWAVPPALLPRLPDPALPLLDLLDAALRLPDVQMRVVQVGNPNEQPLPTELSAAPPMAWIIPHRGSARWLSECLSRLAPQLRFATDEALICLDEEPSVETAALRAAFPTCWFGALQRPGVGPFVARQRAAERTTAEGLLFQDSDDIPTADRATTLTHALHTRRLDAVGSHELRLDYLSGVVVARRFPLDASAALRVTMGHPALFPTLLVRRASLLAVGGFSTYLRFGLDTQLLLRAAPTWRIGNVDAFLYLRRRRPNSLTTDPATAIGSPARETHRTRWHHDYTATLHGEPLTTNSLAVQRGPEYENNELESLP